ncbi:MAG TPA: GFA family protein [Rhodocyclaceae bacterium]|nr:GFA family protein [Rhodocyclaceae bacterium]
MVYKGSCHCGKIAFEVDGIIEKVTECNCSICSRRGSLHWFVPRDNLRLLTSETELSTYTFNKHKIKHRFCSVCGCAPFGEGVAPSGNSMAAINVRCLEGVDMSSVEIGHFDGRSL